MQFSATMLRVLIELLPWLLLVLAAAVMLWPLLELPWGRGHLQHATAEAQRLAEQLLAETLSSEELAQLVVHGYLDVPSPTFPGRCYRIHKAGGPVQVRERGSTSALLCVQPVSYLPQGDVVLMHKLLIEGCEQTYLKTANVIAWRNHLGLSWL